MNNMMPNSTTAYITVLDTLNPDKVLLNLLSVRPLKSMNLNQLVSVVFIPKIIYETIKSTTTKIANHIGFEINGL